MRISNRDTLNPTTYEHNADQANLVAESEYKARGPPKAADNDNAPPNPGWGDFPQWQH
jgi:hypothetical protein